MWFVRFLRGSNITVLELLLAVGVLILLWPEFWKLKRITVRLLWFAGVVIFLIPFSSIPFFRNPLKLGEILLGLPAN